MEFLILIAVLNLVGMGLYHGVVCIGKASKENWEYSFPKFWRTAFAGGVQMVSCVLFPWKSTLSLDNGPTYQFVILTILIGCGAAVLIDNVCKIFGWTYRK
ncbi:MAG: hypothetical protein GY931_07970 [Maribacter sp.]|nr:hypothetical protein [Maribacter sp.]